jgi:hypothetical protein
VSVIVSSVYIQMKPFARVMQIVLKFFFKNPFSFMQRFLMNSESS